MSFLKIDGLNFEATKEAVHNRIREYHQLLHLSPVREEPSVTQTFSFIPPTTNRNLNNIEHAASRNIKRQELMSKRDHILEQMHEAVECMKPHERYIIVNKFLKEERAADVDVYTDLNLNRTKYYELKNEAIVRLAFYLGIEIYKSDTEG
ncbi:ArpU family phage packaging/lysis transcriptional regulator [Salinicoccus sesuvii]|uniref:ArpU family phage packaging/lysis transcriptional regulator n=1 Tax=Salinicoccus sesuvii TaxID=868281 RepID=A0ABV7N5T9_9STAP